MAVERKRSGGGRAEKGRNSDGVLVTPLRIVTLTLLLLSLVLLRYSFGWRGVMVSSSLLQFRAWLLGFQQNIL